MATNKAATSAKKSTVKVTSVQAVSSHKPTWLSRLPLNRAPFVGAVVAEFIGTFLLAGLVITLQGSPIIVMFGLAGLVLLVGAMSGAHLNPAITVGAWATRKITGRRTLGYVVAQVLGAGLAYATLQAFIGGAAPVSAQAQAYGQAAATLFQVHPLVAGKEWYIFFAELLGTTILGFAYASALRETKDRVATALTVGFGAFVALVIAATAASYVTGVNFAALNPAIALSVNALKWELWPVAVYVLAPVIGGVVGFALHDIVRVESDGGKDRL